MQNTFKSILKYVISLILAATFIWLAVRKVDFHAFMDDLAQTRWIWIVLLVLASVGALIFRALRWKALLKPLDEKSGFIECWDGNNVGNLVNVALPGAGEFVRCGYLRSGARSYDKVLGTVVCERVFDLVAIVILLALSLLLGWNRFGAFFRENMVDPVERSVDISLWWLAPVAVLLVAAAVFTVLRFRETSKICKKISDAAKGLANGFLTITRMERKWLFVAYTFGIWFCYVLMCWFGMLAVPALSGLHFSDALFISAIGNLASVIPVPGGIGAYHYLIMISLESIYGIPSETGLLFATLCHEIHAILIIILGIISYIAAPFNKKRYQH